MGLTRNSGPVYGAKSLLWCWGPYQDAHSTGATTGLITPFAVRSLPPYEDWIITEMELHTSTNSTVSATHGVYLKSEGGSTVGVTPIPDQAPGNGSTRAQTIFSMVNTAALAGGSSSWSTFATATADANLYEGAWVPAGSSLRLVSSGISVMGLTQVNVYGYIRFRNSTRGEGG